MQSKLPRKAALQKSANSDFSKFFDIKDRLPTVFFYICPVFLMTFFQPRVEKQEKGCIFMGQNFNCNRKGVKSPADEGSYRDSAGLTGDQRQRKV